MEKLQSMKASGELENQYTKKEKLMVEREIEKLQKLFEGISNMKKLPDAIFVTDVKHDAIAVTEAQKSKVKIIGIVDTNSNPDKITFPIPCNDDATKAIEIMCAVMSEAINEGRLAAPVAAVAVKKEETK